MMAADIEFSETDAWMAANFLFELVLTMMLESTDDGDLREELSVIRDNNLAILSVFELPRRHQEIVLNFLADDLMSTVQPVIDGYSSIRPGTMELLGELAVRAEGARAKLSSKDV